MLLNGCLLTKRNMEADVNVRLRTMKLKSEAQYGHNSKETVKLFMMFMLG